MPAKKATKTTAQAETSELPPFDVGDVTTTVQFRGEAFIFPTRRSQWPTRAMQCFRRGLFTDGVELLLGPQQWEQFLTAAPLMGEFYEFFVIFARAAGFQTDTGDDPKES